MEIVNNILTEKIHVGDIILFDGGEISMFVYDYGEDYPYHLVDIRKARVIGSWDEIPKKSQLESDIFSISQIISHKNAKIEIS